MILVKFPTSSLYSSVLFQGVCDASPIILLLSSNRFQRELLRNVQRGVLTC